MTAQVIELVEMSVQQGVRLDTVKALGILEQARSDGFVIELCGSRRMAERDPTLFKVTNDTDYDYYTLYSTEIETYLIDRGFQYSPGTMLVQGKVEGYDLDTNTQAVVRLGKVDVSLRKDVDLYRTVIDNIHPEVYYRLLWKSSPAKPDSALIQPIFNSLFAIASAAKGL